MAIWVYSIEADDTTRSAYPDEQLARAMAEETPEEFIYYFKE